MGQEKSHGQITEDSPEVKSFIYQLIAELEPFLSELSSVSVVSRDPGSYKNKRRAKRHNILISIRENGAQLEEWGQSDNIFEAILEAKNKLLQKLIAIQESAISQKERRAQIESLQSIKKIQ